MPSHDSPSFRGREKTAVVFLPTMRRPGCLPQPRADWDGPYSPCLCLAPLATMLQLEDRYRPGHSDQLEEVQRQGVQMPRPTRGPFRKRISNYAKTLTRRGRPKKKATPEKHGVLVATLKRRSITLAGGVAVRLTATISRGRTVACPKGWATFANIWVQQELAQLRVTPK